MSVESVFSHHSDIYIYVVFVGISHSISPLCLLFCMLNTFDKIKTFKVSSCVFLTPATKNPHKKQIKKYNRD